ncbi:hypothetical protein N24_2936 [Corynebacterium suranareeae]|uniref:Uncharacterized protein n=1 Tax=Corynebacterium suranareeae TaxID=2506452 RepID=A0A161JPJ0_9CORY|nr:hypothetical protein N24_2936 [Corynebacterium suranareeae]
MQVTKYHALEFEACLTLGVAGILPASLIRQT